MKILCSLFLVSTLTHLLIADPEPAQQNDDLYQSLVFSHYLNKQGVVGGNGWGPDNDYYSASKDNNKKRETPTRSPYHYVTSPAPEYDNHVEPAHPVHHGSAYPYAAPHYPYQYEPPVPVPGYGVTPKPVHPYTPTPYPQTPAHPNALKSLAPYHPPAAPAYPAPQPFAPQDYGYQYPNSLYNQPYNQFFEGDPFSQHQDVAGFHNPEHAFHHPIPHTPTRKPIRFEAEPHPTPVHPFLPGPPQHPTPAPVEHHAAPEQHAVSPSPKPFVHLGNGHHPQSAMFAGHHQNIEHGIVHASPAPVHHAPHHVTPSPHHVTPAPHHVTPAPHHVTPTPHHITPAPHHITPTPHHITPAPFHGTPVAPAHLAVQHHAVTPVPQHTAAHHVSPGPALFHHAVSPSSHHQELPAHPDVELVHHALPIQQHEALRQTTPAPHIFAGTPQSFIFTPAPERIPQRQLQQFAFSPQQPAAFPATPAAPAAHVFTATPSAPSAQAFFANRPTPAPQEAVRSSGQHATPVPIFAIPGALPASATAAPFQQRRPVAPPPPPSLPPAPAHINKAEAPLGNRIPQEVSLIFFFNYIS